MKSVTLQQLERDLDRILDDVIDEREHYEVSIAWINCQGQECSGDSRWEEEAIAVIPMNDYKVFQEVYKEWVLEEQYQNIEEDSKAYEILRPKKNQDPGAWA